MQPATAKKPRLTLVSLDDRIMAIEGVLLRLHAALASYQRQDQGWFDTLDRWSLALELFAGPLMPVPDTDAPPEPPDPEERDFVPIEDVIDKMLAGAPRPKDKESEEPDLYFTDIPGPEEEDQNAEPPTPTPEID